MLPTPETARTLPRPAAAKAAPKDPWALQDVSHLVVGVLGGTGDQGLITAHPGERTKHRAWPHEPAGQRGPAR